MKIASLRHVGYNEMAERLGNEIDRLTKLEQVPQPVPRQCVA